MLLPLKIAWRFLFRSRTTLAQQVFTSVSVLNVAASVMLFLLIHSVMDSFAKSLESTLMGIETPLSYRPAAGETQEDTLKRFTAFAARHPEWQLSAGFGTEFDGLVHVFDDPPLAAKIYTPGRGLVGFTRKQLKIYWQDDYDESLFADDAHAVLVGEKLYERLRFLPGDDQKITVLNPFADFGPSGEMEPGEAEYVVAGVIASGFVTYDTTALIMPRSALTRITRAEVTPWRLEIFLPNVEDAAKVRAVWAKDFPQDSGHLTIWSDHNDNRIRALRLERLVFHLIFGIVLVISAMNLAAVVQLAGISRRREAAILEALGLTRQRITLMHLWQGTILGSLGAVIGLGLAVLIVALQKAGIEIIPLRAYGEMILRIDVYAMMAVLVLAPGLAVLLALIPAMQRGPRDTAEVLRGA